MRDLLTNFIMWVIKLFVAFYLTATNSAGPVKMSEQMVWKSVPITTDLIPQPSNQKQSSLLDYCQKQSSIADANVPPHVKLLNSLMLDDYVTALAWSPNGKLFATSENFGSTIKVWKFPSLQIVQTINLGQRGTERLIFTNDNKFLLSSTSEPYSTISRAALSIIDIQKGLVVRNIDGPADTSNFPLANFPWDFALSQNGKFLFLSVHGSYENVYIYDTRNWLIVKVLSVPPQEITAGPGESQLSLTAIQGITVGEDVEKVNSRTEQMIVWDQDKGAYVYFAPLFSGLFSPYTLSTSSRNCLFAVGAASVARKLPKSSTNLTGYGVWTPPNNSVKIWDIKSKKIINIIGYPVIESLDFSNSFPVLAIAEGDNTARIFFLKNGINQSILTLQLHLFNEESYKVSFSANGKVLAVGGDDQVFFYQLGS